MLYDCIIIIIITKEEKEECHWNYALSAVMEKNDVYALVCFVSFHSITPVFCLKLKKKKAKLVFNTLESQTDIVFCFSFYNWHFNHLGTNLSRQFTFTMSHVAKLYQLLSAKLVLPFACVC